MSKLLNNKMLVLLVFPKLCDVQSTGWVKRESEAEERRLASLKAKEVKNAGVDVSKLVPSWFNLKGGFAAIDCAKDKLSKQLN